MAAGTLDASTKIYAVRVDAVHADAYRVLGGLGGETKPKDGVCVCICITQLQSQYNHVFKVTFVMTVCFNDVCV